MTCRGIRGATAVSTNYVEDILRATRSMLDQIVAANGVEAKDIAGAIFTATPDLSAAYPAQAARDMGWTAVPLMCAQEMAVANSLERCIRVLVLWNTDKEPQEIRHVYLGRARGLRPDLSEEDDDD
jgi:chorismate mutase